MTAVYAVGVATVQLHFRFCTKEGATQVTVVANLRSQTEAVEQM